MGKKTYIRPALKVRDVELQNIIATSLPVENNVTDYQYSKQYSGIWAAMSADDNAAASQQGDDEDDDF